MSRTGQIVHSRRQHRASERCSVVEAVVRLLSDTLEEPKPVSIPKLQGLARSTGKSAEAAAHVEHERTSWERPPLMVTLTTAAALSQ